MINTVNNENIDAEEIGGDVLKMIQILESKDVAYRHCREEFEEPGEDYHIKVYPHGKGVGGRKGSRWWMYAECPKCGSGISLKHQKFFINLDTDISRLFNE